MEDEKKYVTPDEGREMFPEGEAEFVFCKVCGAPLFIRAGEDADCGQHKS